MLLGPTSNLPFLLTLSLLLIPAASLPSSIWNIDIDESPAPPPDKGPALSANASRDPAIVKYQVAGIVVAYLVCLCFAAGVIIYGRRKRRKLQVSDRNFVMETLKPAAKAKHPGLPSSPRGEGYKPWVNSSSGHGHKESQATVSSVDERLMDQHKARDMDELERLYAAVLLQEEHPTLQPPMSSRSAQSSMYSDRPEETHEMDDIGQSGPLSPSSPNNGVAPTPIDDGFQTSTEPRALESNLPAPGLSGHGRTDSKSSHRSRPSQISVRDYPISPPMGSADLRESAAYSDVAPLSPRLYTPGLPPPTPGQKSAAAQAREMDGPRRGKFRIPTALSNLGRNSNVTNSTATGSTGTLPLRQYYGDNLQSAPPTKTTFIDKRENVLHPGPKTGVPFTPYSPYMPYTPLTPVTPRRLVTKEERKRKEKKAPMKVVDEDDLVASDDDMWSTVR